MNKTFLICLIFLILSSCSYKPILSKKNYDFQFVNINSNGERNINQIIIKNLSKNSKGTKKYDIQSTPTLIINEKKFDKTLNYKNLKKYLKKMI